MDLPLDWAAARLPGSSLASLQSCQVANWLGLSQPFYGLCSSAWETATTALAGESFTVGTHLAADWWDHPSHLASCHSVPLS